ncbi:MAG: hypothetical protein IPH62_15145 [Ignavibacteriae bacterium]|nr:hypothetical protein [Ignavibacteriota bacterium]
MENTIQQSFSINEKLIVLNTILEKVWTLTSSLKEDETDANIAESHLKGAQLILNSVTEDIHSIQENFTNNIPVIV